MTVRWLTKTLVLLLVLPLVAGMWIPASSEASVVLVASRAALAGDDFVDWGQLGPVNTLVENPSAFVSNLGITGTVGRENEGDLQRRNENPPAGGWNGNFTPGDRLIWTNNTAGAMLIDLNTSVAGLGANIQMDRLAGLFDATIEVYDVLNNLLASFTVQGNSDNVRGTAIFLGVLSDSANIDHIVLFTDQARTRQQDDFAINQLDLRTLAAPVVPGPASLLLVGLGILALGVAGRKLRG